jgi:hypothetical protein
MNTYTRKHEGKESASVDGTQVSSQAGALGSKSASYVDSNSMSLSDLESAFASSPQFIGMARLARLRSS